MPTKTSSIHKNQFHAHYSNNKCASIPQYSKSLGFTAFFKKPIDTTSGHAILSLQLNRKTDYALKGAFLLEDYTI